MTTVYHYTIANHWPRIVASGCLAPTDVYLDQGERPAVWFTRRAMYEPTAYKRVVLPDGNVRNGTYRDLFVHHGGALRFGLPRRGLVPWVTWRRSSGIRSVIADALARTARDAGSNPRDWYVSFDPIEINRCTIEHRASPHGPWAPFPAALEIAS